MKRPKFILKKKLKDKRGVYLADTNTQTGVIRINMGAKQHRDKSELASTVKHELLHLKNPQMTEKQVYKRTAKTKISEGEQHTLLAKLQASKARNYKVGALKRKFKLGKEERKPGEFINLARSQKSVAAIAKKPIVRTEILGAI